MLADWLLVSPDELWFSQSVGFVRAAVPTPDLASLAMAEREMLSRYLGLDVNERKTVREVVRALSLAASLKS